METITIDEIQIKELVYNDLWEKELKKLNLSDDNIDGFLYGYMTGFCRGMIELAKELGFNIDYSDHPFYKIEQKDVYCPWTL